MEKWWRCCILRAAAFHGLPADLEYGNASGLPRAELERHLIPLVGDVVELARDRQLLVSAFANLVEDE